MFYHGKGVSSSRFDAAKWYKTAAEQAHAGTLALTQPLFLPVVLAVSVIAGYHVSTADAVFLFGTPVVPGLASAAQGAGFALIAALLGKWTTRSLPAPSGWLSITGRSAVGVFIGILLICLWLPGSLTPILNRPGSGTFWLLIGMLLFTFALSASAACSVGGAFGKTRATKAGLGVLTFAYSFGLLWCLNSGILLSVYLNVIQSVLAVRVG
ncbi:MAG: hypothetical protein LBR29_10975 [Methylobacteriaceae bacterium]|jgi:hypothetical protein|nr:hypothetical protein [Methylobacteriaceae bacterium]